MKICVICGDRRDDMNGDIVDEDFCEFCLKQEVAVLDEFYRRQELKNSLNNLSQKIDESNKDEKEGIKMKNYVRKSSGLYRIVKEIGRQDFEIARLSFDGYLVRSSFGGRAEPASKFSILPEPYKTVNAAQRVLLKMRRSPFSL